MKVAARPDTVVRFTARLSPRVGPRANVTAGTATRWMDGIAAVSEPEGES